MLYVADLLPQIRAILAASDLSKISAKGVRKELVARGHDEAIIKENRKLIDEKIEGIYEQLTAAADPGTPSSEETPSNSNHNDLPPSSLPEPLRTKSTVKKEVKEDYKPSMGPNGGAGIEETDAEMASRLQREFDAIGSTSRAIRSAGTTRPKKKKKTAVKRKSAAVVYGSDGETPRKRRGGGGGTFNKELILSDALSALVGEARLSRPQVVKRIWEYVKANDLQDETDKRYILCDDPLRSVFHTDRLHMFTMNKILVDHVRDPDDIAFKQERPESVKTEDTHQAYPVALSQPVPQPVAQHGATKSEAVINDSDDDSDSGVDYY